MSPETQQTHIPDRMTLEHRAVCQPNIDEPMMLRDTDRRVIALVEQWDPRMAVN